MIDEQLPADGKDDLGRLDDERKKNPEEPLWQLLARLGWVPPATAAGFREKIHELEGRHVVAADLEVGQMLRVAGRRIIAVGELDFIYVALEDGTQLRYHRMDSVPLD